MPRPVHGLLVRIGGKFLDLIPIFFRIDTTRRVFALLDFLCQYPTSISKLGLGSHISRIPLVSKVR